MPHDTIGARLLRFAASQPDAPALRYRPGKSGPLTLSYREFAEMARRAAAHLRHVGLVAGDRVAILAENSPEWVALDFGCTLGGFVSVPIYPTMTAEQVAYIVHDCGAKCVVWHGDELREKCPDDVATVAMADCFVTAAPADFSPETGAADDLATIIYTSGTTGNPKGVCLSHHAFLHCADVIPSALPIDGRDTFFAFLPLSHVYGRVNGVHLPIGMGGCVALARNLASIADDLAALQPHVMLCVPRFLEAFASRIDYAVAKQSPLRQRLFHLAMAAGWAKAQGRFSPLHPLLDALVLAKVRQRLGGQFRYFVSGGAALPARTAQFYRSLGLTVLQGFGLTETAGATHVNHPDRNDPASVGEALPGIETRIDPDGEILLRGPSIMSGYFGQPDATTQVLDADGWFRTGDIGRLDRGRLWITDRKKDLLVLANGKNVAPQPIENKLKESPYVAEAVVFGDNLDHCIALIVPDFERLKHENLEAAAIVKAVVDEVNRKLADYERVRKFAIAPAAFSIEGGELTPTMKVKRKAVWAKYESQLAPLA
ncbi:MAG: long-chain fatty acid--CoA ligase [Fimbriimonadaceae bacterium]|nr:long-chain fatty acid--CoA ligase [Fimbriimonadaceae bacterium]